MSEGVAFLLLMAGIIALLAWGVLLYAWRVFRNYSEEARREYRWR